MVLGIEDMIWDIRVRAYKWKDILKARFTIVTGSIGL